MFAEAESASRVVRLARVAHNRLKKKGASTHYYIVRSFVRQLPKNKKDDRNKMHMVHILRKTRILHSPLRSVRSFTEEDGQVWQIQT